MANTDFIKITVPEKSIVYTAEKYSLVELKNGMTIVLANKLKSKFQDENSPEVVVYSIPKHFTFSARKTAPDKRGVYEIVEEATFSAEQLKELI